MNIRCICALLIGSLPLPLMAQQPPAPSPPEPFSTEAVAKGKAINPAESFAKAFNVSADKAKEQLRLQDLAAQFANDLMLSSPAGFVDLEIEHAPNFKITIYYNKDVDRALLTRNAPSELRRYLVFNPITKTRRQLQTDREAIHSALRAANLRFGLEYSLKSGKFQLQIPEESNQAIYEAALPALQKASITFKRGPMTENVDVLYTGWWNTAGGYCTVGWPIRNSAGQESFLTAGHCGPPFEMYFSWRNGPKLTPASARSDTDNGWQTLDYAMYPLGVHTTSRVIYVQNNSQYLGYTNTVPGIVTAYYEITFPRQPVNGQYICKNGGTTGITCGTVIDKNFSDDTVKNLVKVSQSAQPYIAEGGDSGGPVFSWSADSSMVHPIGIMKGTGRYTNGTPCRNARSSASANTACFFVFTPLTTIRAYSPFTVNTTGGFVAP